MSLLLLPLPLCFNIPSLGLLFLILTIHANIIIGLWYIAVTVLNKELIQIVLHIECQLSLMTLLLSHTFKMPSTSAFYASLVRVQFTILAIPAHGLRFATLLPTICTLVPCNF